MLKDTFAQLASTGAPTIQLNLQSNRAISIQRAKRKFDISIEFNSTIEARVVLILDFQAANFKRLVKAFKSEGVSFEDRKKNYNFLKNQLFKLTTTESGDNTTCSFQTLAIRSAENSHQSWNLSLEKTMNIVQVDRNILL